MKKTNTVHIGTSGWSYPHWSGAFYPADLPATQYLDYYSSLLHTVEINNSFYRLPSRETFSRWREMAPEDFIYSVKASRYITHMKKLKDPKVSLKRFLHNAQGLKQKLGPILFQLPPRWRCNTDRLRAFLRQLPRTHRHVRYRYAMEFRDPSWFNTSVYDLLSRFDVAFCIYDLDYQLSPMPITTDLIYIRLHGPNGPYQGRYSDKALKAWAENIMAWHGEGKTVYCYFDNDEAGYAVENALRLQEMVKQ